MRYFRKYFMNYRKGLFVNIYEQKRMELVLQDNFFQSESFLWKLMNFLEKNPKFLFTFVRYCFIIS